MFQGMKHNRYCVCEYLCVCCYVLFQLYVWVHVTACSLAFLSICVGS